MDNLTHALVGYALATAQQRPKPRGAWLAIMLGSQAPDLDLLPAVFNPQAQVAFHRGYSHSWMGLAVIVGLVTLVVGILEPRTPRRIAALWAAMAVFIHILLDSLTSYGTGLLFPFTDQTVALDVLYGVDVVIILVLGFGTWFSIKGSRRAMTFAVLMAFVYIGARFVVHSGLYGHLAKNNGVFSVVPLPNPLNWVLVTDGGENYGVAKLNWFSRETEVTRYNKNLDHPLVKRVSTNPVVRSYLETARYPIAEVSPTPQGWKVKLIDLRLWPQLTFNAVILLDHELEVTNIKVGPRN